MPSYEFLAEQVELSEILLVGRAIMFKPQDLPGRYGRVVRAVDHISKQSIAPRCWLVAGLYGGTDTMAD